MKKSKKIEMNDKSKRFAILVMTILLTTIFILLAIFLPVRRYHPTTQKNKYDISGTMYENESYSLYVNGNDYVAVKFTPSTSGTIPFFLI